MAICPLVSWPTYAKFIQIHPNSSKFIKGSKHLKIIDVLFLLVGWLIEVFTYPFNHGKMMIDGIPNRPYIYFYHQDIIPSRCIRRRQGRDGVHQLGLEGPGFQQRHLARRTDRSGSSWQFQGQKRMKRESWRKPKGRCEELLNQRNVYFWHDYGK